METALFDPYGAPIVVKIVYRKGLVAAAYNLKLSEKDSSHAVFYKDGDNLNPEDDTYGLPEPVESNDGRIIRLSNAFYGLNPENSHEYEIALEVWQDGEQLNSNNDNGTITGQTQNSLMFTKLVSK